MARSQVRPVGDLVFPAGGGQELSLELPKDAAYRGLMILLSCAITATGAAGPSAAGVADVLRGIRVVADGKLTLWNIDAISLRELNKIWFGSTPRETALAAATATYELALYLPFGAPFLYDHSVSLLPAVPLSGLQIFFNVGTVANLFTTVGTATHTTTVRVETHEILDLRDVMQVSPMIVSQTIRTVVGGNGLRHRLQDGNRIAAILASFRGVSGGTTTFSATGITRMQMEHTFPGSGPQILRNTRYDMNRDFTRIFGSSLFGGQTADLVNGFMYHNFVEDGANSSLLDVSGDSRLHAVIDEATGGLTNPQITFTNVEMIPRPVQAG